MPNKPPTPLSLKLSRYFETPPEQVFDAWITPDWCAWLAPGGARCDLVQMEAMTGGKYQLVMTMSDGRRMEIGGVYLTVNRPKKLEFTWAVDQHRQESIISLEFASEGKGTLMKLHQQGFDSPEMLAEYQFGWADKGGSFDKLMLLLMRKSGSALGDINH